jgi:CRISPR-associated endonuclease/helicase Cas3
MDALRQSLSHPTRSSFGMGPRRSGRMTGWHRLSPVLTMGQDGGKRGEERRMQGSLDTIWAKLVQDADRRVVAALPLADHGFDVAAVLDQLLRAGAWDRALTHAAGRSLTGQDIARLVALAALHDIGKANSGFQARRDPKAPPIGHEGQVAALLKDPDLRQTPAGQALLAITRHWRAGPYMAALMAHHGRLREEFARRGQGGATPWASHSRYWRPVDGYDPSAGAAAIVELVRERYPLAWAAGAELPKAPRFIALFAGLLVLADWLGSDVRRFPVEGPHGALRDGMRGDAATGAVVARGLAPVATPAGDFAAAFGFGPRGVQFEAAADDLGPVALIEAETGSGKTEAALWRWLELRRRGEVDGLYFALPTRSAAVQLHGRVNRMLARLWGAGGQEAVLAVPGYWRMGDSEGGRSLGREIIWDEDRDGGRPVDTRWAAEHARQYLAARIAVGTIDQVLAGAIGVRHAPVRAAALARNLLVVDEVHASDAYMSGLLERLLANHVGVGGHALLLSATLGAATRARLLKQALPNLSEAVAQPYPALSGSAAPLRAVEAAGSDQKRVLIELDGSIDDPAAIAARAVDAARAGASVLVIRNTVAGAVAVAQAVELLAPDLAFRIKGVATLHHGRFAASDRCLLDAAVEAAFGKDRTSEGRILVGTQTLEQSLDIDADLLVTDLAPVDVLLQRIGRLHRHARRNRGGFAGARVVVLRPAARDLMPLLMAKRASHGLGRRGSYPDLVQIEATLRVLEANPVVAIPADNRRLVEQALHPEALAAITAGADTAWYNHAADQSGMIASDINAARAVSLDLSQEFCDLVFPDQAEAVATRLGARDLLVDLAEPLPGPFGEPVTRIGIPGWMAGIVARGDQPTPPVRDGEDWCFRLGDRSYRYGRWGLASSA